MNDYDKELENKLIELAKEKEESDKRLLSLEVVIGVLSVIVLIIPVILAAYLPIKEWQRVLLVVAGFIPCIIGLCYAMKIEQVAGYYECKECGHRYVPKLKAMWLAQHMGRTRYMKCPNCGKKSWQKKVISKEKTQ